MFTALMFMTIFSASAQEWENPWYIVQFSGNSSCIAVNSVPKLPDGWRRLGIYRSQQDANDALTAYKKSGTCP